MSEEAFEEWLVSYFDNYEIENQLGCDVREFLNDLWNHQKDKYEKQLSGKDAIINRMQPAGESLCLINMSLNRKLAVLTKCECDENLKNKSDKWLRVKCHGCKSKRLLENMEGSDGN